MSTRSVKAQAFSLGTSVLGAGLLSAFLAGPARAVIGLTGGSYTATVATLKAPGFSVTVGELMYSNFDSFTGLNDGDTVIIADGSLAGGLSVSSRFDWATGVYGFSYNAAVVSPGFALRAYTVSALPVSAALGYICLRGAAGCAGGPIGGAPMQVFYGHAPTSDTFSSLLYISSGKVVQFSNLLALASPGSSQANPVLPLVSAPGEFSFPDPLPRRWFDPPAVSRFD